MQILIIGGGAAGMMAALTAAEDASNQITLLERQNRVGKKLLATGNGRCNLSNLNAGATYYHGADDRFVDGILRRKSVTDTVEFFRALGLYTVAEEDGKLYPLSDMANSVVDVLRFSLEQKGIRVVTSCDVLSIRKKARGYQVETTGESYYGDKVIITCGGAAGKNLGGTRAGYKLLSMVGHSCTELYPSLVQIKTDTRFSASLKGVRADCAMTLKEDGRVIAKSEGEIQFTDFGVSGPISFALSRSVSVGTGEMLLLLDFLRNFDEVQVVCQLQERCERFPKLMAEQLLTGMLNSRLGQSVLKFTGVEFSAPLCELKTDVLQKIAHNLKFFPLSVQGTLGMEHAQVTAGGVPTEEFRADTLESRLAPGIFAAGEVLNVDGDCGGFNLQWAWSSGYVAGKLGKIEGGI